MNALNATDQRLMELLMASPSVKVLPATEFLFISQRISGNVIEKIIAARKLDPQIEILDTNRGEFGGSLATAEKLAKKFGGEPELWVDDLYIWLLPGHVPDDIQAIDFNTAYLLLAEEGSELLSCYKSMLLREKYNSLQKLEEVARLSFEDVILENQDIELSQDDFRMYIDTWCELYAKIKKLKIDN